MHSHRRIKPHVLCVANKESGGAKKETIKKRKAKKECNDVTIVSCVNSIGMLQNDFDVALIIHKENENFDVHSVRTVFRRIRTVACYGVELARWRSMKSV